MNYRKIILFICLITCVLFTVSGAFANDVDMLNETICENDVESQELQLNGSDEVLRQQESETLSESVVYFDASASRDGDGSQSNPYKYYRSGRISYGTTAYFADGVYDITGTSLIYSSSTYATTFVGQSMQNTIFRSKLDDTFDFIVNDGSYFSLKDLTMVNVHINNQANVIAGNVIFRDSVGFAPDDQPGLENAYISKKYNSTCGGVIVCDTPSGRVTTLDLENCYFISNNAMSGGVIATYNTVANINHCLFYNSTAAHFGGAIYSEKSNLNISNSYFELSNAKYGGVIYANSSMINLQNSIFNLSQAYSFGGVVAFVSSQLDINNTLFTEYSSLTDAGGAIYAFRGALNVISSEFRYGHSDFGGAICNLKSNSSISFTEFINNDATYYGGSIYNMYGNMIVHDNNFINSHAGGSGGSIFNRMSDSFYLINNLFINSTAKYGQMVFIDGDKANVYEGGNVYKDLFNVVAVYRTSLNGVEKTFLSNYLTFSVSNNGDYIIPLIDENTQPTANYGDVNFAIYDEGHSSSVIYTDFESLHNLKFNLTKYNPNFDDVDVEIYIINQNGDALYSGGQYLSGNKNYAEASLIDIAFKDLLMFLQYGNIYNIDYYESVPLFNYTTHSPVNLPSSYDSRDYGYITSVKDQKDGGNCWAFAGIATLEACIKKATGIEYDFSEENVKNLMSEYSLFGLDSEINNGGNLYMFMAYLASWFGPTSEENDAYDDYSSLSVIYNSLFHIQNVLILPERQSVFDNDLIKRAVMEYGAVSMGIDSEAHAVVIVGWDDEYFGEDFLGNKSTGAWIIKNSWGSEWEDHGFGYLSYEEIFSSPYTFIFNDLRGYTDVYQYDFAGKSGLYYFNDCEEIYFKNRFTADNDEILSAFSTYFDEPTNFTAYVYLNNQLVTTQKGYAEMGYYTIPLVDEIVLNRGDVFEIAVKVFNADPVYIPLCVANEINRVTFEKGTSFYSTDGRTWYDLYDDPNFPAVVCLKAFTRSKTIVEVPISINQFSSVNVGEAVSIQVSLPEYYVVAGLRHYLDGLVTFIINGQYYYARVADGKACLNISFDEEGVYNLTAQYKSNKEISNIVNFTFNVIKTTDSKITIQASDVSKFYGGDEKYIAVVSDNGNLLRGVVVKISVNGRNYTKTTNADGQAILDLDLPVGFYNVVAEYGGKSCSSKFRVISTISTADVSASYLNSYVSASFLDSKGNAVSNMEIAFHLANHVFKATTDNNGFARAKINVYVGNYTLTVANPLTGEEKMFTLEVFKADTECMLSISQSGSNVTIEASINPIHATGHVYFVGGGGVNEVEVHDGVAILTITDLSPGTYNISATYSGDDNFKVSFDNKTFSVVNHPYHLISYNYWSHYGLSGTMATIVDDDGKGVKGELVRATILNNTYTAITDEDGDACFDLEFLDVGTYAVLFEFRGQSFLYRLTVNSTIIMGNFSCEYLKSKVSAVFINPFDEYNNGGLNVKFRINEKEYNATTNSNGYASVDVDLPVGTYTVTAINLCNGEQKKSTLTIYKATPAISIEKYQSGCVITLTASLNPTIATGNVIFTVGERKITSSIDNGKAMILLNDLEVGSYEAYARYTGDNNFINALSSNVEFTIVPATIHLSAPKLTKYYGDSQNFTISLKADDYPIYGAVVKVVFRGETNNSITDVNGMISIPVKLNPGSYDIQVSYGDNVVSSKITIKSTISCSDLTYEYSNSMLSARFYDTKGIALNNKKVAFNINGIQYDATTDSYGVATSKVSLNSGAYIVNAINLINGEIEYFNLTITKSTPNFNLILVEEADADVLVASLPSDAKGINNYVFEGYGEYPTDIVNGISRQAIHTPGTYNVNVTYSGDNNYYSITKSIKIYVADRTPKLIANDLTKVYGDSKQLTVRVLDYKGNPLASAKVLFNIYYNNRPYQSYNTLKTDSNGYIKLSCNFVPRTYSVVMEVGNAGSSVKLVVKKATPKLTASKKTFKVKVKTKKYTVTLKNNRGQVMKSTKVTLKVKGKIYSAKTNSRGQATFKITKLTKKGTYTATVKYAGSAYYNSVIKKVKITVKK